MRLASQREPRRMNGQRCSRAVALRGPLKKRPPQGDGDELTHAESTSSLRAQRSNPVSFRGGILDCFAALANDEAGWRGFHPLIHDSNSRHAFAFSRRNPPELCSPLHALSERKGAGKAGCRLAPARLPCKNDAHARHRSDTGQPQHRARETIAARVIELAQRGERCPTVLRDRVLAGMNAGPGRRLMGFGVVSGTPANDDLRLSTSG